MSILTLGYGAVGGSATSDNITPLNLINVRRVAVGLSELSDLRGSSPAPSGAAYGGKAASGLSREDIEAITRAVLLRLNK